MSQETHKFFIPVMGTGFTIDSILRVGKYGISSVMSLVDDRLIDKVRCHYAKQWGLSDKAVPKRGSVDRAKRIQLYLELCTDVLCRQVTELQAQPFAPGNDKSRYFRLLPDTNPAKAQFLRYMERAADQPDAEEEKALNQHIVPGRIGCNIMTKLDGAWFDRDGKRIETELSDAKAAILGLAEAKGDYELVLSAGVNPTLFGYLESFSGFYPDEHGHTAKKIILKVSDLRSALIQGKLLAKKGFALPSFAWSPV
ncbi:MAG: hypothetical protein IPJ88_14895 [Myxococcales bacterium]|nr:MAG: hypothetical protein IPJ88_14895 [Myxococcales bacterium]